MDKLFLMLYVIRCWCCCFWCVWPVLMVVWNQTTWSWFLSSQLNSVRCWKLVQKYPTKFFCPTRVLSSSSHSDTEYIARNTEPNVNVYSGNACYHKRAHTAQPVVRLTADLNLVYDDSCVSFQLVSFPISAHTSHTHHSQRHRSVYISFRSLCCNVSFMGKTLRAQSHSTTKMLYSLLTAHCNAVW